MLLILSEKGDLSTNDVIDWLVSLNVPFIRLNADDPGKVNLYAERTENGLSFQFSNGNVIVKLENITAYWYRRGGIPQFKIPSSSIDNAFEKEIAGKIKEYINLEARYFFSFLHDCLDKIPIKIGSSQKSGVNKLIVLEKAVSHGLMIPDWCVSMQKNDTLSFIEKYDGAITKGIWESLIASTPHSGYSTYTELIEKEDLASLPQSHFPSLLQQNIRKKYEVRTFYLHGRCWSMAIFSQRDPQTSIDFRKYNDEHPNRNIPFKLPNEIERKLHLLMVDLGLESGSADFIVDEQNQFIFLEVNPVGQFGMTSSPCNYGLEKEIALYLAQMT